MDHKRSLTSADRSPAKRMVPTSMSGTTQTMKKLAYYLAKKYARLDPKHKQYYYRNAKKYVSSLTAIDQQIEKCRQLAQKQKVDVSEPVFDYALENLAIRSMTVILKKQFERWQRSIAKGYSAAAAGYSRASDRILC